MGCSEGVEDMSSDVALEAAAGLFRGRAFGQSAFDGGTCVGVGPDAREHDGVQRRVELPVPATMEPVADRVAR